MKHLLLVWFVGLLFFVGCYSTTDTSKENLHKVGDITVIELHGNYKEMGRQYGTLLKDQLQEFYSLAIEEHFVKEKGLPLAVLKQGFQEDFDLYPERFKSILYGMAETSGLDLSELILLDQIVIIGAVAEVYHACSGLAAWGEYTNNNTLVFGRNFDYPKDFKKFSKYMTMAVYHPDDGSIAVASFGYTGQVQITNGMNKNGLFLELNAGSASDNSIAQGRTPTLILFLSFLFDSSTMEQLDSAFNTHQTTTGFIVNTADKNKAYSYEWATYDLKRIDGENDGFLVATNHYVHPDWSIPPLPNDDSSVIRRNNLLLLGEKYKGQFNEQKMMEVLDTNMEDGGATKPEETIYQIVAVPEKLKMWIKIRDLQDWTQIDLNDSF